MTECILALDQGTTSSRALLITRDGKIIGVEQEEFAIIEPQPGWVEQNPEDILGSQLRVVRKLLARNLGRVVAIGITNQRETTILWDRITGKAIGNAIVWQDRRTAARCNELQTKDFADSVRSKTGLVIDPYFSATKIAWLLQSSKDISKRAHDGEILFGTVDSFLLWHLTGKHLTDVTNASRTMLFNIHSLSWDEDLLSAFSIPRALLPQVVDSGDISLPVTRMAQLSGVPIAGIAGDQQAALFGQLCLEPGMAKNTYGTGCFLVLQTGSKPARSHNGLITTVGWKRGANISYALEGSVFVAGAAVQWLRDELKIIKRSADIEALANSVPDSGGVTVVPAFTGLGAPYWDASARGSIFGLTRGTTSAHIARATLEGIASQVADVVEQMNKDTGSPLKELRVDGGSAKNDLLLQIQADMLGIPIVRPKNVETTAQGAAYLAGLSVGFWKDLQALNETWEAEKTFEPTISESERSAVRERWANAIRRMRSS